MTMSFGRMTSTWNADTVRAFKMHRSILTLLGSWPLQMTNNSAKVRWLLTAMSQITMMISLCYEMYLNCRDVESTIDVFMCTATSMSCMIKLIVLRFNRENLILMLKGAIEDWRSIEDPKYCKIMKEHASLGRFICFCLTFTIYLAYFMYITMALIREIRGQNKTIAGTKTQREFPLMTTCSFKNISTPLYCIIFIVQIIQGIIACTGTCINDALFFALTMHLCGQLEVLKIEFKTVGKEPIEKGHRRNFNTLVKRHKYLIESAKYLEDAFNVTNMWQLSLCTVLICIEGLQLIVSLKVGVNFSTLKHSLVMIVVLIQLCLYSFSGDYLRTQSEGIAYAIYDSDWYNFASDEAKDLGFVMTRASIPLVLTAGKFIVITLENFKDILKTSASYMSFLRVMLDK